MDIHAQIEDLEANIDDLTDALSPILSTSLSTTSSTLPLLDKAKFHILLCYTIESLLYSSIQASGQDGRKHAIFGELARLKAYFQKVKDAEEGPAKPKMKVDKDAVGRFVKHGLAGNERFDQRRAEELAKRTHKRFDEEKEKSSTKAAASTKRKAEESPETKAEVDTGDVMESSSGNEELYGPNNDTTSQATSSQKQKPSSKNKHKRRKSAADMESDHDSDDDAKMSEDDNQPEAEAEAEGGEFTPYTSKSTLKQQSREARKAAKAAAKDQARQSRRAERREKKIQQRLEQAQGMKDGEIGEEQVLPAKNEGAGVGKGHSEVFNQLLEGTYEKKDRKEKKGGKKSKREKGV